MDKLLRILVFGFIVISFPPFTVICANRKSGIMVDCARRYNSVDFIKGFIDSMAFDDSYLILHLTDNESVGIECRYLGQTAEKAERLTDGSLLNPATGKRFLSQAQVKDLIEYASERNVEIIPEIEMPGHFNGFFELVALHKDSSIVEDISVNQDEVPGELRMNSEDAKNLAHSLIAEYAGVFRGCRRFSIGADEYWTNYGDMTVDFINSINHQLAEAGYSMVMYNDLITKENMQDFNHDIEVAYWSRDGMASNDDLRAERIAVRASLPELQQQGFNILLTNSYYLYFVPSLRNTNQHDLDYTVSDILRNWSCSKWDDEHEGGLDSYTGINGANVSLWLESADGVSDEVIQNQVVKMYRAMREKMMEGDETKVIDASATKADTALGAKFMLVNGRLLLSIDGVIYTLYGEKALPR